MHSQRMSTTVYGLAGLIVLASVHVAAEADAPRVVELSPENGATDVDPAITRMWIKFDQDMGTSSHSLCGGGDSFPEIVGTPKWTDARTFVIRVKLKRDHDYELSVNCQSFQNFRSAEGVAVQPVPWSFATAEKSKKKSRAKRKKLNKRCLGELMGVLHEEYSYYELRGIDWKALAKQHRKKIHAAKSTRSWVNRVVTMLGEAKDMHLWVDYKKKRTPTFVRRIEPNFHIDGVRAVLPSVKQRNACVITAKTDDNIGYILISTLGNNRAKQIGGVQEILDELKDCKSLILDLRPNGGGNEMLAMPIAAWFVKGKKTYAKHVYRDADGKDGFGSVQLRTMTGNQPPRRFDKPIAVLMGPSNMSSCEAFILMMRQGENVTLFGGTSYGSSGNPKAHLLDNGVTVYVPSWKAMRPDGTCFEGEGIKPDIEVEAKPDEFKKGDPVIERALRSLRRRTG